MRIAVCGSHATGKTTLIAELKSALRDCVVVDEPYHLLVEQGHIFPDVLTPDDFVLMFEYAAKLSNGYLVASHPKGDRREHAIFDRTVVDYLGYLVALEPSSDWRDFVADAKTALESFDAVVFVPIESPDLVDTNEAIKLRRKVDRLLREMLIEQSWGFDVPVVEVSGTVKSRLRQILEAINHSRTTIGAAPRRG